MSCVFSSAWPFFFRNWKGLLLKTSCSEITIMTFNSAIVYILLIHPLITQHHIFRYKIRIVWNYYIYLASAGMINRCVVFECSNMPSETVSLYTSLQVTDIVDRYGPNSSTEPVHVGI